MLKFRLDSESHSALSEAEQTFYEKSGDDYQLMVEGAVDKSKLDEFRTNNVQLLKDAEKFKGVDLEKYNKALEAERVLREEQLIKDKDFDTLISEKTAVIQSDYEAKIKNLEDEIQSSKGSYQSLISKHEIEGAANTAFTKHKISPDAHEAAMAQVRANFSINNGEVVSMNGDKIITGANGNLTIDEFVGAMPEIFKIQSNGGRGRGESGFSGSSTKTARDKIASGLASRSA